MATTTTKRFKKRNLSKNEKRVAPRLPFVVPPEVYESRIEACRNHIDDDKKKVLVSGICRRCGCAMKVKARFCRFRCPDGIWERFFQ